MPYIIREIKDIPKWLSCPLCTYETKIHNNLLKHLDNCEEYDGGIDDIEDYYISDDVTISDYIKQQMNCINTTKKLIQTNELDDIKQRTPNEIRLFIKNKLLENIPEYYAITGEVCNIYTFFFGDSEENNKVFCEKLVEYINIRSNI